MRRTPALAVSAFALALAFGLAGCSADTPDGSDSSADSSADGSADSSVSPSQAPTPDADAATGDTVAADGYSFAAPEGWGEEDSSVAPGTDTVAVDLAPVGDFATNVNVVVSAGGAIAPELVEASAAEEFESLGATDVAVLDRVTVAGEESAHITAVVTSSGVTYRSVQFYVPHEESTYIVTFSFDQSVTDEEITSISESVLASFAWS